MCSSTQRSSEVCRGPFRRHHYFPSFARGREGLCGAPWPSRSAPFGLSPPLRAIVQAEGSSRSISVERGSFLGKFPGRKEREARPPEGGTGPGKEWPPLFLPVHGGTDATIRAFVLVVGLPVFLLSADAAVVAKLCLHNSTGITPAHTHSRWVGAQNSRLFSVCMTLAGAGTGLQSLVGFSDPVVRFHLAHVMIHPFPLSVFPNRSAMLLPVGTRVVFNSPEKATFTVSIYLDDLPLSWCFYLPYVVPTAPIAPAPANSDPRRFLAVSAESQTTA